MLRTKLSYIICHYFNNEVGNSWVKTLQKEIYNYSVFSSKLTQECWQVCTKYQIKDIFFVRLQNEDQF